MELQNLIPFDLEKAKSGYQIVTRDGTPVTEWHYFETAKNNDCVFAAVGNDVRLFDLSGVWISGDSDDDPRLFLLPKETSMYRNVYSSKYALAGKITEHETLEDAMNGAIEYGKTTPVEFAICVLRITTTETGKTTAEIAHTY